MAILEDLLRRSNGPRKVIGNAMNILATGKPLEDENSELDQFYKKELLRRQMEDPEEKMLKQESLRSLIEARNRGPFWLSPQGQDYYTARTGQAEAQGRQAMAESDLMEGVLPQVKDAMSGNSESSPITPGAKIQVGPVTLPLNPELSESEARTFSTVPVLNDAVAKFNALVNKGTLENKNPLVSAYRGFAVDKGWAPMTFGQDDLSDMQAELNRIKANTLFSEGGKNLTVNERQVIENLFSTSGKDRDRIINDTNEGVRKYNEFIQAKKQGMFGYNPGSNQQAPQPQATSGVKYRRIQ